jgi:hypothetical protein
MTKRFPTLSPSGRQRLFGRWLRRALGIRVIIAGCLVAVSAASGCGGNGGAADRGLSDGLVPSFAKVLGCRTQSYAFDTLSRLPAGRILRAWLRTEHLTGLCLA